MIYLGKCWDGWSAHSRDSLWSNYPLVIRHGKSSIYRFIYIYLFIYLCGCGRFIYIFFGCGTCVGYSSLFYCFILQCKHLQYKVWESLPSGIFRWPSHDSSSSHLDQKLLVHHISTPSIPVHLWPHGRYHPKNGEKRRGNDDNLGIHLSFFQKFPFGNLEISCVSSGKSAFFGSIFPLKWVEMRKNAHWMSTLE